MALKEERSVDKAIANITTNTVGKIVLTLILFSQVTNSWSIGCLGRVKYTIFFENRLGDDLPGYDMNKNVLQIKCQFQKPPFTLNPNGSLTVCGGWLWDPFVACFMEVTNFNWTHRLVAFSKDTGYGCKEVGECRWQIRNHHPFLYSPTENKYIERVYWDDACKENLLEYEASTT
ncbi:hypothetical protein CR513_53999, partial [Mucuna pruriens]